ncbi:MAG: hypothetical protein QXS05_06820 [Candidatus Bathyarchaeia archaeon]
MSGQNRPTCPHCGSESVQKIGFITRSNPYRRVQRYRCKNCRIIFTKEEIEAGKN